MAEVSVDKCPHCGKELVHEVGGSIALVQRGDKPVVLEQGELRMLRVDVDPKRSTLMARRRESLSEPLVDPCERCCHVPCDCAAFDGMSMVDIVEELREKRVIVNRVEALLAGFEERVAIFQRDEASLAEPTHELEQVVALLRAALGGAT